MARTVAELIVDLQKLDPDAVVHSNQPPFTGVRVIPQKPGGAVMIAAPERQASVLNATYSQGRRVWEATN